jgi:uncharacterized damage-inducible protein DinB
MDVSELLLELFGRIPPLAQGAVDGLDVEQLTTPPGPGRNTIAWLVWHVARVQDSHVAELLDERQLWVTGPWAAQFGLAPDAANSGYGHTAAEVAAVQPERSEALLAYLDAIQSRTSALLARVAPADLDRVVDRSWDPPVTLGVRLVSVADDSLQHLGQAAYLRGLLGY